jgi:hypothetical protein
MKDINIVTLGDIHAGSRAAICVPDMTLNGGGSFRYSAAQKGLFDAWCKLAKDWNSPDILIANGDLIEGQARKESGVPCWSTDLEDQMHCAEILIKMFKPKKLYIINGTGYHVDAAGKSLENILARQMGAEKIGAGKDVSAEELFLKVGDTTFHASHHIQVGTGWYRSTPVARELIFALLNESHKHKVDVVLRSHVHSYIGLDFTRQKGFTLPCWQLQTRYMYKKSALGMVPDIGALRFRIHDGELSIDKGIFKIAEARPTLFKYEQV